MEPSVPLQSAPPRTPRADFLRRSRRRQRLHVLALGVGVLLGVLIHGLLASRLSAADRGRLSPLWVFPLCFGANGLVVERLMRLVETGQADNLAEAARQWNRRPGLAGRVGRVLLVPFRLFRFSRYQSPWMATFLAAVFWALVLVVLLDLFLSP